MTACHSEHATPMSLHGFTLDAYQASGHDLQRLLEIELTMPGGMKRPNSLAGGCQSLTSPKEHPFWSFGNATGSDAERCGAGAASSI